MKKNKNIIFLILISTIIFAFVLGNSNNSEIEENLPINYNFSNEFNEYWNRGKAEIASYELSKARYGEIHEGDAALVFVTEPFLPIEQVKSDGLERNEKPEKVMKLIKTEKFFTGIYPYSIMTSTFYPLNKNRNGLLKLTMSSQDWCGQVYTQLNNRDNHLEFQRFSYFQKEGDIQKKLENGLQEEELFTQIRVDPTKLPTGNFHIYPSTKYIRLMHKDFKKYKAKGQLHTNENEKGINKYILQYLDLDRKLEIEFESAFPYKILSLEDSYIWLSGKKLTTIAKLKENIHTAYWKHNSAADSTYRMLLDF